MQSNGNIFHNVGIEIELLNDQDFLKIRETLTRIGTVSQNNVLTQVAYILHKRGRYVIAHHNELRHLDGEDAVFSETDLAIRNTVAVLLEDWGLLELVEDEKAEFPRASLSQVRIIPFKEKKAWTLVSPYDIGKKRIDIEDVESVA
jgi:hypothetical protein